MHDPASQLNIDPIITWNTFLGSINPDYGYDIAVDEDGNVYVVGVSYTTWGTPVNAIAGRSDVFVAKLDSNGTLLWNTFMGTVDDDEGFGIAVDSSGNIYVVGTSWGSWGTPVNPYSGWRDAFVSKLDRNGARVWNTFLGSASKDDYAFSIAVDVSGNIYVVGRSFYTWGTPVNAYTGVNDAFAAMLSGNGTLMWNTFLGSEYYDDGFGIAIDGSGNVYVSGCSDNTWGTPVNAYTENRNAFAAKLNNNGVLLWNTFLGSVGWICSSAIAVEGENSYVVGYGVPMNEYNGTWDAYTANLDSNGVRLWNTSLGSVDNNDLGLDIAVDGNRHIYVVGRSNSTWGKPVNAYAGRQDAFVVLLDIRGIQVWNDFLGSVVNDDGYGIAVDENGNVYVVGSSGDSWGTPENPYMGQWDAFIAKLSPYFFISGNANVGGATLSYTDGTVKTVSTDSSGDYSLRVTYDWTGMVTPSKAGYTFIPDHRDYSNVTSNLTGENYAVLVTISGNAGVGGATLTYTGGSTVANGSGNYSITVAYGWTGTVTPSKAGYTFSPDHRDYSNVTANLTNENYNALVTISGNAGIGGAILSYTGGSTIANGGGYYSITVSYGWSGIVTPSKSGYIFLPDHRDYSNVMTSPNGENYTVLVTISGNAGGAGVTLTYAGGGVTKTAGSDQKGNYSFTVPYGWSGTVRPTKRCPTGPNSLTVCTFSPLRRVYTNVQTNQANQNYVMKRVY
jgi:hypothetical protein